MARTATLGSPARLARRLGSLAALAGAGALAIGGAAPARAIQTINYTAPLGSANLGALADPSKPWYVQAKIEDGLYNPGTGNISGTYFTFTTNLTGGRFVNDFVFNLDNNSIPSTLGTVYCFDGTGTKCVNPPLFAYDPTTGTNPIQFVGGTKDWELELFTAANTPDRLENANETISFFIAGFSENWLASQPVSDGGPSRVSCTHAQGLPGTPNSIALCSGPPLQDVPAPLPIFGAGVAFAYSRRLRLRIAQRRSTARTTALA